MELKTQLDMKINVNWKDIEEYIIQVAEYYKDKKITGVYGLPRGGLVLAVMLSHKMNIPLLMAPTKDCIIIDDICDSGESLIHYTTNRYDDNKYHITTMYFNFDSNMQDKIEFYVNIKDGNWIIFPWEVE